MMDIYQADEMGARELKDWLGWRNGVTVDDLTTVLMSALEKIERLEGEVARLKAPQPNPGDVPRDGAEQGDPE